jgi:hypothetical protein
MKTILTAFALLGMGGGAILAQGTPLQIETTELKIETSTGPGPTQEPETVLFRGLPYCTDEPEESSLGFFAGAGFYYVRPLFSSNPAILTTQLVGDPARTFSATATASQEFKWDYQMAPRFWLGYEFDDGWLIRSRYWRFHSSPDKVRLVQWPDQPGQSTEVATVGGYPIVATSLVPGMSANTFLVSSGLHLDVADFEAGRCLTTQNCMFTGTAGIRYADLTQSYNGTLFNPGSAFEGEMIQQQQMTNAFHGVGPTLAGQGRYYLGGGLSLFGDVRGSLLYGHGKEFAGQVFLGGAPAGQAFASQGDRGLMLPVGELELGVGWDGALGQSLWSFNVGFASQMWWNAGSASVPPGGTFPSLPAFGPAAASPVVSSTSSNLGFAGLTVTLGVQF